MDKASLESEVQELRKQVELLTDSKESRDEVEEPPEDAESSSEDENLSHLRVRLEEFMGTLQKDLREIPATTAVAIFALGVLVGRLISR